jgi:imidazole glycerol phosphate synthase glutamine amidotransferase subunit
VKRIGIIDYGAGNLHSVRKALAYLGAETEILEEAPKTISFNSLVLPGVGNFGPGMEELEKRGFHQFLGEWFREDRPFLGICLGMQFLFEKSEECPGEKGLGFLKGEIRRFADPALRVPQIGWNAVYPADPEDPLFRGIEAGSHFYFVHSYYCVPQDDAHVGSRAFYGLRYCSSVRIGNAFAVQFHPEKSQENGLAMLRNFLNV